MSTDFGWGSLVGGLRLNMLLDSWTLLRLAETGPGASLNV